MRKIQNHSSFKILSAAAMAGLVVFGTSVNAQTQEELVMAPIPEFTQTEFGDKDKYTNVIEYIPETLELEAELVSIHEGITLDELLEQIGLSRDKYEQVKDMPIRSGINLMFDASGNPANDDTRYLIENLNQSGLSLNYIREHSVAKYYLNEDKYIKHGEEEGAHFAGVYVPKASGARILVNVNYGGVGDNPNEVNPLIDEIMPTDYYGNKKNYLNLDINTEERIAKGIDVDFIASNAMSSYGGAVTAIVNGNSQVLNTITSDFINNSDLEGILNAGEIKSIHSNFMNNILSHEGSYLSFHQSRKRSFINNMGVITDGIINSNFINNTILRETNNEVQPNEKLYNDFQSAHIFTASDLNIEANHRQNSIISGNKSFSTTTVNEVYTNKTAIFASGTTEKPTELSLTAKTGGKLVIDDEISGNNYKIKVAGDKTGVVYLNNNIRAFKDKNVNMQQFVNFMYNETRKKLDNTLHPVDLSLENTNLVLGRSAGVLDGHNLTLNSGALSLANGEIGISAPNTLTVAGNTNFFADVDLANSVMDRISAKNYGKHTGNLNVSGMNLLSDAKTDRTEIYFAENGLKDNVTTTVSEVAYTPIYKYSVKYDNRNDGGYFVFNRSVTGGGSNGGNPAEVFNPSVLSAPIAGVAASQATVNETFKYVFEHADAFTKLPEQVRQAKINANKYALSTDFNHNLGSLCPEHNNKAGWFKPYVTFEKIDLKNGPKVNATTYGSLAGFDTDFFEHKNGWHSVGTGYVGYNGSQLRYKGIDTTMNGGILGYTHTMYKGNFWSALTLSAGASVGQSNTMYGKEDFTSLLAGVGSKTGYNFEFKEGKYILQPVMFLSYTFVNTFDYTNAAGVKINADPAHSIQLNPSVRFIANTKNGWQPYASVGMVWNVMNENKVTANEVRLPEMGMKPYVEYGVGIQKNWKDRFTAFGQAMLRNGGRTGIALTGGFRWAIGREGKPIDKVQGVNDKKISLQSTTSGKHNEESLTSSRKILKQLTPQQKMALTGKKNTTITINNGILKQL